MSEPAHERRQRRVFILGFGLSALSLITVAGFVAAQAYIRWSINQNFTFLGGNELEALTVGAFALALLLLYLYRPRG